MKTELRENSDLPYTTELDLSLEQGLAKFFMYKTVNSLGLLGPPVSVMTTLPF